jgi:hypothetical protein
MHMMEVGFVASRYFCPMSEVSIRPVEAGVAAPTHIRLLFRESVNSVSTCDLCIGISRLPTAPEWMLL